MPFRDVIGHRPLTAWLARQVASGTVSHAYLLFGPEGVGKRFIAQQLAQALQCQQPAAGEACGRCAMCHLVAQGQHPDVMLVAVPEGAQQIKIEQIRQMQHGLAFMPFHGRRKVVIIDQAETMPEAAASALLKTLEEPPPTAVLILVAAHESRLLPTIVSRCAKLHCGPLPAGALAQALQAQGVDPARAAGVTRRAGGRLGRGRSLASDEVWHHQRAVLDEWLAAVEAGDLEPSLAARPRAELEELLEDVAAWYHDLLLAQTGVDPSACAFPDRAVRARAAAAQWTPEQVLDAIDAIYVARALIQARVNPRTALAVLVARLR